MSVTPDKDFDWIFDFMLQFLESDRFDAAVMDFIDEKCECFDNDDENKLIYTEIHREFREHIEALITTNLSEFGITVDIFFEACEKGRGARDINRVSFLIFDIYFHFIFIYFIHENISHFFNMIMILITIFTVNKLIYCRLFMIE